VDLSLVLDGLVIIAVCVAWALVMPWARKFDRKVADRREAQGKPRSIVPPWIMVVVCIGMIIGGSLLMRS
jgi:hypothetical protein